MIHINDILIPSNTGKENLTVLEQVLLKLKRYRFELNFSKCQFFRTKIEYLGYKISSKGITLTERRVEAVRNLPVPNETVCPEVPWVNKFFPKIYTELYDSGKTFA